MGFDVEKGFYCHAPLETLNHHAYVYKNGEWEKKLTKDGEKPGEEVYVLSGAMMDEYGCYPAGTWIRSPHNSEHCPYVEDETIIWIKTGHLLS